MRGDERGKRSICSYTLDREKVSASRRRKGIEILPVFSRKGQARLSRANLAEIGPSCRSLLNTAKTKTRGMGQAKTGRQYTLWDVTPPGESNHRGGRCKDIYNLFG